MKQQFRKHRKASKDILLLLGCTYKTGNGIWIHERKGDDVISFREKPNQVAAIDFIAKGNFLWNSGMFCFKAGFVGRTERLFT
jgi:mannose-1-phosphate guanylyltransferase